MNKISTSGLLLGGLVGVAGISYLMSDKKLMKIVTKEGTKMMKRAAKLGNF